MNWATFQTLMTFHEILIRLSSNEWLVYFTCKTGQFFITYIYPKQHKQHVFFHCSKMFPCKCPKNSSLVRNHVTYKQQITEVLIKFSICWLQKRPGKHIAPSAPAPPGRAQRTFGSGAVGTALLRYFKVGTRHDRYKWSDGSPYKWCYKL